MLSLQRHIVALLVGIVVLAWSGCASGSTAGDSARAVVQPVKIAVAVAEGRETAIYVHATGGFVADESSDVAPPAAGRIARAPVDVGDFVGKGQVVAHLDTTDLELRVEQAAANLDQARASLRQAESRIGLATGDEFDASVVPEVQAAQTAHESAQAQARLAQADAKRYESLVETGDVSLSNYQQALTRAETARAQAAAQKQQYQAAVNTARQSYQSIESARAAVRSAEAQLSQAENALTDTAVLAPFAWYVTARPVALGEYVAASATIVTLVRVDPIRLELQIPEAEAARLEVGLDVTASVAAYRDIEFRCKLAAINPAIDPESRAIVAEARCPNTDRKLRPGMFSNAHVLLGETAPGVYVPDTALLNDPMTESTQAFVIEDGVARVRVVQAGDPSGDDIRVLSGLQPGETVAAINLDQLFDGAPVDIMGR